MATVLLTPTFVLNGLKCPSGLSKIEYCDTHPESKGLYIEVSAKSQNVGIYRLRQKIDGKTTHFLIGKTNSITLDNARRQVVVLKNQINTGVNPKTVAKNKKQETITLKQFFDNQLLSLCYFEKEITLERQTIVCSGQYCHGCHQANRNL